MIRFCDLVLVKIVLSESKVCVTFDDGFCDLVKIILSESNVCVSLDESNCFSKNI